MAAKRISRSEANELRGAFLEFTKYAPIESKDAGPMLLGDSLYYAQKTVIDEIFDGLPEGIHDFKIGKSRQLGCSTISRMLTSFWAGVNDGLRGSFLSDTGAHVEEARLELVGTLRNLPRALHFPSVRLANTKFIQFANESRINFAAVGTTAGRSSGVLGRSTGSNFLHASEVCSWGDPDQVESFRHSLSELHPRRLYIWETTGRGAGVWKDMWAEARLDPLHQRCIVLGWWSKETQVIEEDDPDFQTYGLAAPTDIEIKMIADVRERYGVEITPPMLAWFRRKMDPARREMEAESQEKSTVGTTRQQEQLTVEEDMFIVTGATFFDVKALTNQTAFNVKPPKNTWRYFTGLEFTSTKLEPTDYPKQIQLRIWEEAVDGAAYCLGADPAYGTSEHNDRGAIQVARAYADGLDQVAEYAWPLHNTRQYAWVIASLLGYYGGQTSIVDFMQELNGPGEAVWMELMSLKRQLERSYMREEAMAHGLAHIFKNVRNYIYTRADGMGAGNSFHMVTNSRRKVSMLERLRDVVADGTLAIRSEFTIDEMRDIVREGDKIGGASTSHDDRVMSLALMVRLWEDVTRKRLMREGRTRQAEHAKAQPTIHEQVALFNQNQVTNMLADKRRLRAMARMDELRHSWRRR